MRCCRKPKCFSLPALLVEHENERSCVRMSPFALSLLELQLHTQGLRCVLNVFTGHVRSCRLWVKRRRSTTSPLAPRQATSPGTLSFWCPKGSPASHGEYGSDFNSEHLWPRPGVLSPWSVTGWQKRAFYFLRSEIPWLVPEFVQPDLLCSVKVQWNKSRSSQIFSVVQYWFSDSDSLGVVYQIGQNFKWANGEKNHVPKNLPVCWST